MGPSWVGGGWGDLFDPPIWYQIGSKLEPSWDSTNLVPIWYEIGSNLVYANLVPNWYQVGTNLVRQKNQVGSKLGWGFWSIFLFDPPSWYQVGDILFEVGTGTKLVPSWHQVGILTTNYAHKKSTLALDQVQTAYGGKNPPKLKVLQKLQKSKVQLHTITNDHKQVHQSI